nr:uncharacterized mitochondrial protein AtMg00810-like [Tanacetum cinerariifolium]
MVEKSKLDEDKEGKAIDPSHYRGMIGTLLYLTVSRPDLQFAICMCARYQAWTIKKHIHAVKRIFRYLRGTVNQGLWYLEDSFIALTALQMRITLPATTSKAKSLSALSEVAMTEVQQLKLATKRSLQQIHISQANGSGVDEGTGTIPRVPDVPTDKYEEEISWNSTDEE